MQLSNLYTKIAAHDSYSIICVALMSKNGNVDCRSRGEGEG